MEVWDHSCTSHNSFAQSQKLHELSFMWGCGNAEARDWVAGLEYV